MNRPFPRSLLVLLLAAAPAAAQTPGPGQLGEERTTARERAAREEENARWQLGPLRLDPRLAISDLGYVSNIYFSTDEEAKSDFKAQGSAGIRAFFNLGPKVLVNPFANLSYSWWREQVELRSLNESFGLQLFGDLNRLQLELQAGRVGVQQELGSELAVPVDQQTDRLDFAFDVNFWGPLRMFGRVGSSRLRYSGEAAEQEVSSLDLAALESDGDQLRGGLEYEFGSGLRVGLGVDRTETVFLQDPAGRSNTASGPVLTVRYPGARLNLDVDLSRRDVEFDGQQGSGDRRRDDGRARLGWRFTEKLSGGLYAGVSLNASALDSRAIYEYRRAGVSLRREPGPRTRITIFYETGEDEFFTAASDQVTRVDDERSYGVNLRLRPAGKWTVELGYVDLRRTSSDPEFDRELGSLVTRVSFGGNLLPW